MRKDSKQLRMIVRNLKRIQYQGTEEDDRLMSAAELLMPKASQESLQSATALIVSGVCANAGIPVNVARIVCIFFSGQKI